MLATPAYGGRVTTVYMNSVVKAMASMPPDIQLVLNTYPGDSLITRGRNTMVAQFLDSDCDAILWIDADIGFDPHHILRLVEAKKDVIAGVYPIKEYLWDKIVQAVKDNPDAQGFEDVAAQGVNIVVNGIGQPDENGIAPVAEVGTGFMLIQRSVFERMMQHYPDRHYLTDRRLGEQFTVWNFFDAFSVTIKGTDAEGNHFERNRYLSEDYAFCALWRGMGGEIFVDVGTNMLSHQGDHIWGLP